MMRASRRLYVGLAVFAAIIVAEFYTLSTPPAVATPAPTATKIVASSAPAVPIFVRAPF